ncbi:MAG: nucleotidyl transferase AbiEii/AbiGii toxin family protein [Candidatus Aminicenantes bacterium]|nr:nucleotidyl transferase AbiEii/AbiGii toxin family protein [Candidatus Aminicenantes bacterium]
MFESILTPEAKAMIEILSKWPAMHDFYLSGGTAAALQLGHRTSHDFDFFSQAGFRHQVHARSLRALGRFLVDYTDANTLVGRFNDVKVGFFHYPYPLLKATRRWQGINIASLEDIACSKMEAISSRGKKRDFVDLYFILKTLSLNLKEMLRLFEQKYGSEPYNLIHIQKSLVFFQDAEQDPEPRLQVAFSWEECKSFFVDQIRQWGE